MAATEAMDSLNGFDPTTPSTWHAASLSQLQTLSVAVLQQELKPRNLSHTGNKSTLSKHLHEALISPLTHPMPTRLHDKILAGEYIDFNGLLTYAMFSTHDGSSSSQIFTMQMSPQSAEMQFAPTPTYAKKINSFPLWMEAWNVYAGTVLGESSHNRLPITISLLQSLKHQLRTSNLPLLEQCLLWATFTMAFYGFLHVSEFTGLSLQWSDIHSDTQAISVSIHKSKMDPFHEGHVLCITSTGTSTCPVSALHKYTSMIPKDHKTGPLFSAGKFNPLTRSQLSTILRHLLQQAGYDPQLFCTHSFRIGVATTSAAAGLPPWLIRTMGWLNSDAYQSYV